MANWRTLGKLVAWLVISARTVYGSRMAIVLDSTEPMERPSAPEVAGELDSNDPVSLELLRQEAFTEEVRERMTHLGKLLKEWHGAVKTEHGAKLGRGSRLQTWKRFEQADGKKPPRDTVEESFIGPTHELGSNNPAPGTPDQPQTTRRTSSTGYVTLAEKIQNLDLNSDCWAGTAMNAFREEEHPTFETDMSVNDANLGPEIDIGIVRTYYGIICGVAQAKELNFGKSVADSASIASACDDEWSLVFTGARDSEWWCQEMVERWLFVADEYKRQEESRKILYYTTQSPGQINGFEAMRGVLNGPLSECVIQPSPDDLTPLEASFPELFDMGEMNFIETDSSTLAEEVQNAKVNSEDSVGTEGWRDTPEMEETMVSQSKLVDGAELMDNVEKLYVCESARHLDGEDPASQGLLFRDQQSYNNVREVLLLGEQRKSAAFRTSSQMFHEGLMGHFYSLAISNLPGADEPDALEERPKDDNH